jgi:hypothetical protein
LLPVAGANAILRQGTLFDDGVPTHEEQFAMKLRGLLIAAAVLLMPTAALAAPRIERAAPHMTQTNAARGGGGPPINARAQMPAPAALRAAAPAMPHGGGAPHINAAPRGGGVPGGGGGHGQDKPR